MSTENKIEYYFLRASAEKFAADLRHLLKMFTLFLMNNFLESCPIVITSEIIWRTWKRSWKEDWIKIP